MFQCLYKNLVFLQQGLPNLQVHIENLKKFTSHLIVTLNVFATDTPEEIEIIRNFCNSMEVEFSLCETYSKGGVGAVGLADRVVDICRYEKDFKMLYDDNEPLTDKIEKVCKEIYHAGKITYTDLANEKMEIIKRLDAEDYPICIAKTQYSISDDPKKLGYPQDYEVTVRDLELRSGAGFITVFLGSILTMPGLPKTPNYEIIDVDENNEIVGLF